jgi:hypothetical protein
MKKNKNGRRLKRNKKNNRGQKGNDENRMKNEMKSY